MENPDISRVRKALSDRASMLFNSGPVVFAYLYGSYARGDVHTFSDIDIGIYLEKMPPKEALDNELSLALKLEEILDSRRNVDVRSINNMPIMIKGCIVTEGILIYSRNEALRVEFEIVVRKAYFDFRYFFNRHQKAYLSYSVGGH